MNFKKTLLAATLLSLPMAAQAQSWDPRVQGLYVGAGAGFNYLSGSSDTIGTTSVDVDFGWGFAGVISVGYGFGNGLRLEVEGSYRQNDVDNISASGIGNLPRPSGTASSYGVMFNALYDFRLGPVMPYVGAGVGYVINDWDDVGFGQRSNTGNAANLTFGGDSGTFAYQAIVGIALPIESVPGLALTAEYRFLGTAQVELDGRANGVVQFGGQRFADRQAFSYSADNYNHSIMFGVRYNFGRTAAPAGPGRRGAGAGAHLPGVLRLEPRRPDRARAPDHRGSGAGPHPPGGDAHRSDGSHRHLGLGRLQPGPVGPPRRTRWLPSWCAWACRAARSPPAASARRSCWCRPRTTPASRRTAAWRSCSANRGAPRDTDRKGAPQGAPFCVQGGGRAGKPATRTAPPRRSAAPRIRPAARKASARARPASSAAAIAAGDSAPTAAVTSRSPRSLSGSRLVGRRAPYRRAVDVHRIGDQRRRGIGRGRVARQHRDRIGDAEREGPPVPAGGGDAADAAARA